MLVIIAFLIGLIIGALITRFIFCRNPIGTIKIDTSDPDDGPYMFLELSQDLYTFMHKKYAVLKIKVENYISQK